jgi:bacteriocin-like protein
MKKIAKPVKIDRTLQLDQITIKPLDKDALQQVSGGGRTLRHCPAYTC